MADGEAAPSKEAPRIVLWHGNCQRFGAVGHPQRWVNVLGTVESGGEIASALFSLNGAEPKPFSLGPDGHRLARPGDFNIDLDRAGLLPGENTLWLRVETREGASDEARVAVEYANPGARWPLPYSIDWSRGYTPAALV